MDSEYKMLNRNFTPIHNSYKSTFLLCNWNCAELEESLPHRDKKGIHRGISPNFLGEERENRREIKVKTCASLPHRMNTIYSIKTQRNKGEDMC